MTEDTRTSAERIEDLAFENRIRALAAAGRFKELEAVCLVYGSALNDREGAHQ